MKRLLMLGWVLALGLFLAGCATKPSITKTENLLAAAGFRVQYADSPQKLSALAKLPAHKLVGRTKDGKVVYVYADPEVCKCVYFGNENAYQNYRRMLFEQNVANEQRLTADIDETVDVDLPLWGFGPGLPLY
jgi:hypothetical protein